MTSDIILYGETRGHKTRLYQAAVEERGLWYALAELDPALRGAGTRAKVTIEVFEHQENSDHDIHLTCPFLRRVGATRPE